MNVNMTVPFLAIKVLGSVLLLLLKSLSDVVVNLDSYHYIKKKLMTIATVAFVFFKQLDLFCISCVFILNAIK